MQSPSAQDARPLVLGHVGRGGPLFVGDLLVLVRLFGALASVGLRGRIAGDDNIILLFDTPPVVLLVFVASGNLRFELVVVEVLLLIELGLLPTECR